MGFSLRWLLLPWSTGSRQASVTAARGFVVVAHRFIVAPWHVESSRTRARNCVLALAGRFLSIVPLRKSQVCPLLQFVKKVTRKREEFTNCKIRIYNIEYLLSIDCTQSIILNIFHVLINFFILKFSLYFIELVTCPGSF